jgi:hypothetical protein
LRKTVTIESAPNDERRFRNFDDRQQQRDIPKKKLDRTITLPTGSSDVSLLNSSLDVWIKPLL